MVDVGPKKIATGEPEVAGKVVTGFSEPWVAKYSASGGTITYSGAMKLARGVSVDISPSASDSNKFYADNQEAESAPKHFTGGTMNLTVDGLLIEAESFLMGLPAADTDGFTAYGDSMKTPYVGVGYIVRYMCGGVESYVPTIIVKALFDIPEGSASTQEEEIDWQTQQLSANIFRGDDANHNWKYVGMDYPAEEAALTALKTKLGVSST